MKFKSGDKVKLMSGGPEMTVRAYYIAEGDPKIVTCNWFDGPKLVKGNFAEPQLQLIQE